MGQGTHQWTFLPVVQCTCSHSSAYIFPLHFVPSIRIPFLLFHPVSLVYSQSLHSIKAPDHHVVNASSNTITSAKHTFSPVLVASIQSVFSKDHHLLLLPQGQRPRPFESSLRIRNCDSDSVSSFYTTAQSRIYQNQYSIAQHTNHSHGAHNFHIASRGLRDHSAVNATSTR